MARQRLKIVPDRVFHKLWDRAGEYEDRDGYVSDHSSDRSIFDFQRYGLTYPECLELLQKVYDYKSMTLKDIMETLSVKKSDVSHIFCIPIRTIEDWYSGKNRTPSYFILILLKHFHMFSLGKYVRLESTVIHMKTQPSIYIKHAATSKTMPDPDSMSGVIDSDENNGAGSAEEYYDEFISGEEYEKYLDRLIAGIKGRKNNK